MIEYRIANCLGHHNVTKAIEDRQAEDPNWKVHSITASDVEDHQVGHELEMEVQVIRITRFAVLFEREINDESLNRDVNPGGIKVL